ncbi:MAG TPA: HAMP domain-containing histidine kinase [Propionibacterium sp.]|nr:HAMP domain-containing histidine kinase [Propionibacterium sp.]
MTGPGPVVPAPAASHPRPEPLGAGTLSRRLILSTTALVAVIAVLLSGLTALTMHRILQDQLDEQLLASATQTRGEGRGQGMSPGRGGPGLAQGLLFYWQGQGGIVQVEHDRNVVGEQVAAELERVVPTGRPETRALPSLGPYRIVGIAQGSQVMVVGLPLAGLTASMASIMVAAVVLTLMAIIIAFLAARTVVERNLRPLARLATTAHQVSALPLGSGAVDVPVRFPAEDTDPRSEVGQVGIAFNRMLDHVEGALGAREGSETKLRRFVADASHELRNPLAAIRGYAELTRRERPDVPATTAHALERIESESERMSHLVEDLLLLARLDSGPALEIAPTPLSTLVADAVSDARAAGPDHAWALSLPDAEVVALADRHRLTQVVANLLANARTHTPAGTRVTTSLAAEQGWAVVRVSDDGPGIPPEVADRVFERFTRADASRSRAGGGVPSTGLGLAIVAAVVAAHGGHVDVRSRPGHTEFTVRVPLAPVRQI